MKKITFSIFAISLVSALAFQSVAAQFPIKIPKITKPKVEQPAGNGGDSSPQTQPTKQNGGGGKTEYLQRPEPTDVPVFLPDSLEVKLKSDHRYWKAPGQDNYTSWVPAISFDLFFDNSVKTRYMVEWFNADGSPWFTEPLNVGTYSAEATVQIASSNSAEFHNNKGSVATGTYGFKIVNTKTNEPIFQGKYKVNKVPLSPGEAKLKNMMMFYVDHDWSLPIGYVGFNYSGNTNWDYDPKPIVFMWFKGNLDGSQMEARLFHDNQQIATTDDGGFLNFQKKRGDDCFENVELCKYHLREFNWDNFIVENEASVRERKPKATFTRDKPGEYTVKIFYKGAQVREAKFTIDPKGWIAPNAFSKQIYLTNHKVVIPVQVMGNLDKWNANAWKTEAFYGNPLTGFSAP